MFIHRPTVSALSTIHMNHKNQRFIKVTVPPLRLNWMPVQFSGLIFRLEGFFVRGILFLRFENFV